MGKKNETTQARAKINRTRMRELFPSHQISKDTTYFAITLGAAENSKAWTDTQTYWVGFADKDNRVEIRKIRAVVARRFSELWKNLRQPYSVVNNDSGFVRWQMEGGHALITEEQVEKNIPEELEPRPCVMEGRLGFTDFKKLPKTAFQKAPTPKLRMEVLKRDKYRCMICGQRPADDTNIQLQVHHIRPYGQRGITVGKNLISLCHTCHAGLEPHYEYSLFELVEGISDDVDGRLKARMLKKYITASRNYRKSLLSFMKEK